MVYNSVQDVLDTTDKSGLQKKLTELNVDFKPQHGVKTLATLLFEATGGVTENVTSSLGEKKAASKSSDWESLGDIISKKAAKVKKAKGNKMKHYIHKWFNVNLSPNGIDNKGKRMRYAKGLSSLIVSEQMKESDVFDLGYIKFKGIEGTTFNMNGFEGRSILSTSNDTLQEYIESHKSFGNLFVLYDKEELNLQEYRDNMKLTDIQYGINHATDEEIICTLSYMSMGTGRNNFSELFKITDGVSLRLKALRYAKNNPDLFIEATASKEAKVIMLGNLAKEFGAITVTGNETQVKLASSGKVVCNSSRSSDWQTDLKDYLFTPEGQPLAQKLEMITGYRVF